MTTSMLNSVIALSKDLGDFWAGTFASDGNVGGTTEVDAALKAKTNDWVTDYTYDQITSGTYSEEERKVSALDNTTGTLTTLAHGGKLLSGVTYNVHRLFSGSDKRQALIQATKLAYPAIHTKIRDESKTAGNWLSNGNVETWTVATYPDNWRVSVVTATKTATAKLFNRGSYSCKLSGAAGYLYQSWTENDDLKYLRGKGVTFRARGWCDTPSALRLAIYDGVNTTYSDYHEGDSSWDDETSSWYVSATIDPSATDISFRAYLTNAAATAYVDDLRVSAMAYNKVYIGDLGIALDRPIKVSAFAGNRVWEEPIVIRNYALENGYLYLNNGLIDVDLRIEGVGYLDFLKAGAVSTAWDSTIAINDPQLQILTAQAVIVLYTQSVMPNFSSGDINSFQALLGYWKDELANRIGKFKLIAPNPQVKWGSGL